MLDTIVVLENDRVIGQRVIESLRWLVYVVCLFLFRDATVALSIISGMFWQPQ